jgi:hypothetical protein
MPTSSRLARGLTAAALLALSAAPAAAQRLRTTSSSRQLQGEQRLAVEVEYGAGRLTVAPAAAGLLYSMEVRYDEARFRPVTEYDRAAGRLRLGVESRDQHGNGRVRGNDQHASIGLSNAVPLSLQLRFGAGEAALELGGLALQELQLETGASSTRLDFSRPNRVAARLVRVHAGAAEMRVTGLGNARAQRFEFSGGMGETTLDFGGAWDRNATARIEMGVGSLHLRLPRALGVKIIRDSFMSSFDAGGMVRRGNAWYSRNYDQARYRLDLEVAAALGSIEVDWTG